MGSVPEVTLSSDCQMPLVGMGVAAYPFVESEKVKEAMIKAIEVGYRHFDTSPVYMTEQALGEAIIEALSLGLIKSRDELFITSKLWCCDGHHDRVVPALQKTLQALQLEYLDLFLIHWPISTTTPEKYTFPIPKDTLIQLDFESVWASMEECQRLGLTKSIGVSNFSCKKLETLLTKAKIPPAVVQVEMSPLWQQNKLRDFCKDKGITVVAYSPLGAKGSLWGTNRIMECVVLKEIAIAKGKTHAQICLRWVYEQRVGMLVKSFNEERMKENLEIFDWELSEEESKKISEIPQSRGLTAEFFISADGPFKSKEELWDGEI